MPDGNEVLFVEGLTRATATLALIQRRARSGDVPLDLQTMIVQLGEEVAAALTPLLEESRARLS